MLKLNRSVAIMEEGQAVKKEAVLRVSGCLTDHVQRLVRVFLNIGYVKPDKTFVITDPQTIQIEIQDMPPKREPVINDQGQPVFIERPAQFYYTLLTTPQEGHGQRWSGDFRIRDVEELIIDNNLLPQLEIEGIIDQL